MNAPIHQVTPTTAPAPSPAQLPRVLLVEDDPVSCAVLTAAVLAVPAQVDSADTVAGALALADLHDYALWLFDANLPDGNGAQLLATLRGMHQHTPALAHTATNDTATLDALIAAGFLEVLVKPLPAAAIQGAVRRVLGLGSGEADSVAVGSSIAGKQPVWDDDAAARALGNHAHVAALRGLFLRELPGLRLGIDAAALAGDLDAVRASLHKLRASCGFVGAARLGEATRALHQQTDSQALLSRFDQAVHDTLDKAAHALQRGRGDQGASVAGDGPGLHAS